MGKIKILHCGDIHLDTPFKEFDKILSQSNREEIKKVLRNIIDICNKQAIDILLIAGDFFDNNTIKKETLNFVKEVFLTLDKTRVFISPGNHDPYYEKSFYKLIDWPKNVYIFKEKIERIDLENVSIHGFGFTEKYEREGLLKNIDINEDKINILVGHGDFNINGSEYNPISKEDIYNSKLDYIALGHIHQFNGIEKIGRTYFAYSGCPQGRGFDEEGEKGILIGEIDKEYIDLKFLKTSIRDFKTVEINITGIESNFKAEEKIMISLQNEEVKKDFLKIILKGEIETKFNLDLDIIKENLKDKFYFIKLIDKTKLKISNEDEKLDSAKKIFIDYIKELDEEEEILNIALNLGLKSLISEEVSLDDY